MAYATFEACGKKMSEIYLLRCEKNQTTYLGVEEVIELEKSQNLWMQMKLLSQWNVTTELVCKMFYGLLAVDKASLSMDSFMFWIMDF